MNLKNPNFDVLLAELRSVAERARMDIERLEADAEHRAGEATAALSAFQGMHSTLEELLVKAQLVLSHDFKQEHGNGVVKQAGIQINSSYGFSERMLSQEHQNHGSSDFAGPSFVLRHGKRYRLLMFLLPLGDAP